MLKNTLRASSTRSRKKRSALQGALAADSVILVASPKSDQLNSGNLGAKWFVSAVSKWHDYQEPGRKREYPANLSLPCFQWPQK
jgi:hypothetical protein